MKRINNKYLSVFFMSAKLRLINKDMKNKQLEGFNVVLEISNTYKKVAEVFCLRYLYSPLIVFYCSVQSGFCAMPWYLISLHGRGR